MEHQKLRLLQPSQRTVMDPVDAVEPTGHEIINPSESTNTIISI